MAENTQIDKAVVAAAAGFIAPVLPLLKAVETVSQASSPPAQAQGKGKDGPAK